MATTQHYVWASGHFILLIASLRYFLAWITLKSISAWWYKASYFGALVSYAIVCQKSLGTPQPNITYLKRALADENVQYFILAFFWSTSKPIAITLLPFAIFSLFHALTFTRTTLMSQFLPSGPPASANGQPTPHPAAKKLHGWVKANYGGAMRAVAYAELAIFVRVTLGAITFQNSLISPIIFAHFLRQRYYQSEFTREAFSKTSSKIDELVTRSNNANVASVWGKAKGLIARWSGSTLTPAQGPPRE